MLTFDRKRKRTPVGRSRCSDYSQTQRQLFISGMYLQRVALLDVPSQKLLGQSGATR
jgi:hypothetical protein